MAWAKNGTPDTLSSSASSISISDLTAKKLLVLLFNHFPDGNVDDPDLTVDVGSTGDYAVRGSQNGSTDVASTSGNEFRVDSGNNAYTRFHISYIVNIDGEEKLGIGFTMRTLSGASSVPDRKERFWKVDTSTDSSQIGSITITPTGNMATGSNLSVLTGDETGEAILGNNVQSGSRFEATDTRKIYYGALPSLTFEDDFTSNNFTYSGSSITYDSTNKRQNFTVPNSLTADYSYYNLGSALSNSSWVLQFKLVATTWDLSTGNSIKNTWIGLFDNASDFTTSQSGVFFNFASQEYDVQGHVRFMNANDIYTAAPNTDSSYSENPFTTSATAGTYYVRLVRDGNTGYCYVYSDNTFSTLQYNKSFTIDSNMPNLQYLKHGSRVGTASGTISGYIDDIEIFDGVTSTTDLVWTEEV